MSPYTRRPPRTSIGGFYMLYSYIVYADWSRCSQQQQLLLVICMCHASIEYCINWPKAGLHELHKHMHMLYEIDRSSSISLSFVYLALNLSLVEYLCCLYCLYCLPGLTNTFAAISVAFPQNFSVQFGI